ncbi:MAG: hypothetical protein HRT47_09485 [Candidatus Caenarcaniphilales bacterium]|nr:hypothetical protein [Candidatus Caenarcaniphilales bacterium]
MSSIRDILTAPQRIERFNIEYLNPEHNEIYKKIDVESEDGSQVPDQFITPTEIQQAIENNTVTIPELNRAGFKKYTSNSNTDSNYWYNYEYKPNINSNDEILTEGIQNNLELIAQNTKNGSIPMANSEDKPFIFSIGDGEQKIGLKVREIDGDNVTYEVFNGTPISFMQENNYISLGKITINNANSDTEDPSFNNVIENTPTPPDLERYLY